MEDDEYIERVYAGVLGKVIGVYMGRPFEGWTYERIVERFGEVSSYVNEEAGCPLVVTDDDIAGTFTFIRALEDYGYDPNIGPVQIGRTWLNYLVYKRTILWWGGFGNSTEHTAYLRLRSGIDAPASGSAALNGTTAANQIGAEIFIDGWAMTCPGNPAMAARFARAAASVSHDGEAVNAAVAIAAIEASAFVERDIEVLLDTALARLPRDSLVARLVGELLLLRRREPDWRAAREWLDRVYGYDRYKGVCHVIPNFGLVVLSLLYGDGDFRRSLMIANTCGHDTDCNAGNVGCILGLRNGLPAIEACPDLRVPHGDLLFLSSADGGRCVSDAAREAYRLADARFGMEGRSAARPKDGARYHFALSGSLHAFRALQREGGEPSATLANALVPWQESAEAPRRALEISFDASGSPQLVATPTFIPPDMQSRSITYECQASPALYPGQVMKAMVAAHPDNPGPLRVRLFVSVYDSDDEIVRAYSAPETIVQGDEPELTWKVESSVGGPIMEAGVELWGSGGGESRAYLLRLDWAGAPDCSFRREAGSGDAWRKAWVDGVDVWSAQFSEPYRLSQDSGIGLIIQGTREWADYSARARITPFLAQAAGLAVRVQGLRRYYALILQGDGRARLVKELDGTKVLAEQDIGVEEYQSYDCVVEVEGTTIRASIDGEWLFEVADADRPLSSGALGLLISEGTLSCDEVAVGPLGKGWSA